MDFEGAQPDSERREVELLSALAVCPLEIQPQKRAAWQPLAEALAFIEGCCGYSEEAAFMLWKQFSARGEITVRADREILDPYEIGCSDRLRKDSLFLMHECRSVAHVESNVAELRAALDLHLPGDRKKGAPASGAAIGRRPTQRKMCRAVFDDHPELLRIAGKQLFREVEARLKQKYPRVAVPSLDTMERAQREAKRDRK